jgi:hypothetical protein
VNARIDLLLARADAGDCELVAKGSLNQAHRGFLYLGNGSFRSDRAELGIVSTSALRAAVDQQAERLTFTCVPPGTGLRIGIDRDEDGVLDGDDPLVD